MSVNLANAHPTPEPWRAAPTSQRRKWNQVKRDTKQAVEQGVVLWALIGMQLAGQEVWWHLPEFPPSRLSPVQSNAPFPLFLPSHTVAILGGLSNCPEHPIGPSQLLSGRLSFLHPLQLLFGFKATPQTTPTRVPKLSAQFVTFMILLCPHRHMQ